jgi:hypothetical protein
MTGNTGIRLLGFAGFEASERFLRSLDDDIWVSRWDRTAIPADRPEDLNTSDAMRAALEQPSRITVVSAHAGYFNDRLGFCGEGDQPVLTLNSLGTLGAASMLLIDACCGPDLAAELKKSHGHPGSLIAALDYGPGKDQFTKGRDSVTIIGAVIRELCYPARPDLSPEAAARAVDTVNGQNHGRKWAQRPLLRMLEC